jgi:hypothetical protein
MKYVKVEAEDNREELVEELADIEHQQWAHWTKYMLDNLTDENIARWKKQIETPYEKLTEKEKDSDREWALKTLEIVDHHDMPTDMN